MDNTFIIILVIISFTLILFFSFLAYEYGFGTSSVVFLIISLFLVIALVILVIFGVVRVPIVNDLNPKSEEGSVDNSVKYGDTLTLFNVHDSEIADICLTSLVDGNYFVTLGTGSSGRNWKIEGTPEKTIGSSVRYGDQIILLSTSSNVHPNSGLALTTVGNVSRAIVSSTGNIPPVFWTIIKSSNINGVSNTDVVSYQDMFELSTSMPGQLGGLRLTSNVNQTTIPTCGTFVDAAPINENLSGFIWKFTK